MKSKLIKDSSAEGLHILYDEFLKYNDIIISTALTVLKGGYFYLLITYKDK